MYQCKTASLRVPDSSLHLSDIVAPMISIWVLNLVMCSTRSILPSKRDNNGGLKLYWTRAFQISTESGLGYGSFVPSRWSSPLFWSCFCCWIMVKEECKASFYYCSCSSWSCIVVKLFGFPYLVRLCLVNDPKSHIYSVVRPHLVARYALSLSA